jgi:hypothetical protein
MHASVGDQMVVPSQHVGTPERQGVIVEVRGEGGSPPYVVHWSDTDEDHLFVPAPGAIVEVRPADR